MDPEEMPHAGFVEEFEIHDAAEDVKEIRFIGSDSTVAIDITDETMCQFIVTAYEVKERIERDMGEIQDLFESFSEI